MEERTIQTYEYDENNNKIKFLRQRVDTGRITVNSEKRISTYDSLNNKVEVVERDWIDNKWQNSWRHAFEYNDDSYLTLRSIERWVNQSWKMHNIDSIEYENQWNEPSEIHSYWFDDQSEMYPNRFLGLIYDQTGMLDTAYYGTRKEGTNDFRITEKIFLELDEENNKATINYMHKSAQLQGFVLFNTHEFDFSDDGNLKFYMFSRPIFDGLKYRVEYF
ncbi:MAG: hypothetical protein EA411_12665 [Saprospirales bacterium]|nr:MAG: hypothetical protein EA411_12665 [Saprospirales bacterium]